MANGRVPNNNDPFLQNFDPNDIRIASEFLTNWLPFLTRGLCRGCTRILSDRIRSLNSEADAEHANNENGFAVSTTSIKDMDTQKDQDDCCNNYAGRLKNSLDDNDNADTHSLGSWKDEAEGLSDPVSGGSSVIETHASPSLPEPVSGDSSATSPSHIFSPRVKMSWADMAMEDDELGTEEEGEGTSELSNGNDLHKRTSASEAKPKVELSREQREYLRFSSVVRNKDFRCFERVKGKLVNILQGLELHTGVFSAAEQKRIVNYVEVLQEMGRNGQLKERTYSAPKKWMRGKGRITLQFGCCYNYAPDKNGNLPGILRHAAIDPLPQLFKTMIKRFVRWHVLPPTCVPDSCIVNIYDEGDCIPPHIDNHDFVRPFCTVSFLSECEILFGSSLKTAGPGEFSGSFAIPLPVGSVLVLNGNGADVAKHCVPAVPTKRISITFRKMDESKQPIGFVPEPDLQGLEPLPCEVEDGSTTRNFSTPKHSSTKPEVGREEKSSKHKSSTPKHSHIKLAVKREEKTENPSFSTPGRSLIKQAIGSIEKTDKVKGSGTGFWGPRYSVQDRLAPANRQEGWG